jgi:hypothetical protein
VGRVRVEVGVATAPARVEEILGRDGGVVWDGDARERGVGVAGSAGAGGEFGAAVAEPQDVPAVQVAVG